MLVLLKFSDVIFVLIVAANVMLNLQNIADNFGQVNMQYAKRREGDIEIGVNCYSTSSLPNVGDSATMSSTLVSKAASCKDSVTGEYTNPKIELECPVTGQPEYYSCQAALGFFMLVLLVFRVVKGMKFASDDWRSLLYMDQLALTPASRAVAWFGNVVIFGTLMVGIYVTVRAGSVAFSTIWILCVFFVVSVVGVNFSPSFVKSSDASIFDTAATTPTATATAAKFLTPIPIVSLPGGNGFVNVAKLVFDRSALFSELTTALAKHLGGDSKAMRELTDEPEQLAALMLALSEEDDKDEDDAKEKNEVPTSNDDGNANKIVINEHKNKDDKNTDIPTATAIATASE